MFNNYSNRGFGLLEIVLAVSIISLTLFGLSNTARVSYRLISDNTNKVKAAFLLEETIETVRILRDQSWQTRIASLSVGTNYFLTFNGTQWRTSTTNVFVDDIFERKIQVSDVYRDANDDIAASGTLDPDTKKITASVSWGTRTGTSTESISTYITDLFDN